MDELTEKLITERRSEILYRFMAHTMTASMPYGSLTDDQKYLLVQRTLAELKALDEDDDQK